MYTTKCFQKESGDEMYRQFLASQRSKNLTVLDDTFVLTLVIYNQYRVKGEETYLTNRKENCLRYQTISEG